MAESDDRERRARERAERERRRARERAGEDEEPRGRTARGRRERPKFAPAKPAKTGSRPADRERTPRGAPTTRANAPATAAGRAAVGVTGAVEEPLFAGFEPQAAGRGARQRSTGRSSSTPRPGRASAQRAGAVAFVSANRERIGLGALVTAIVLISGFAVLGGGDDGSGSAASQAVVEKKKKPVAPSRYGTPTKVALPPDTRVVGYTGAPQADELGILGTMPFEQASDRLDRQAVPYDRKSRPVLHAFDLIATIANAHPGTDGKYRTRQTGAVIAKYLRAARRHNATLILDIQPGTSNFVDETKALRRWLKEPDVQIALDPEWRMRQGVRPGSTIGHVSAGEITATLAYIAAIVKKYDLPPKLVLVHRFTDGMIENLDQVKVPKAIVPVISVDGVGTRELKTDTYRRIAPTLPKPWLPGFKLFYVEDAEAGGLMSGAQVMALKPRPHVVLYE